MLPCKIDLSMFKGEARIIIGRRVREIRNKYFTYFNIDTRFLDMSYVYITERTTGSTDSRINFCESPLPELSVKDYCAQYDKLDVEYIPQYYEEPKPEPTKPLPEVTCPAHLQIHNLDDNPFPYKYGLLSSCPDQHDY